MKLSFLAIGMVVLSLLPLRLSAQPMSPTLQVSGRHILDRCGNTIVLRGLEQNQTVNSNGGTIINGSWNAVVDQADTTRANQIRIILEDVNVSQTRGMVERAVSKNLVVEIHTSIGYYSNPAVQQMVQANKSHLILGIFGEPAYEDRARWRQETMEALQTIRALGYDCPVLIMANLYGRDLPSVLDYGQTLVNADPLHRVIMGWQAYWGSTTNWYQTFYGMTFQQAMVQITQKNFPIQVGITFNADDPPDIIDYPQLMALTRQHGISTHFWDYYSRNALDQNKLVTRNMTTGVWSNTSLGQTVLVNDPNSFWNQNAPRACTISCYPNCDGSTVAPVLSANDFQCFFDRYAGAAAYANCDGSTVSPVLNANDFQCFLSRFAGGCP